MQTNDLIFPAINDQRAICSIGISVSGNKNLIRYFIAICSALYLNLSVSAQDSEAFTDTTSLTNLKFEYAPAVRAIDNREQSKADEQSLDFELQIPAAGMLEEKISRFAEEDTWRWTMQFGYGIEFDDSKNKFALGGFGFSYFPIDDFSLNVEFDGMYFEQDRTPDTGGFNFNILLRWHYLTEETWSAFVESSVGIVITSDPVPALGGGFNFIAQLGAGVSVDLGDDVRLLTGLRWHHLSNGRTFDNNPGQDSIYAFAGLSMPF